MKLRDFTAEGFCIPNGTYSLAPGGRPNDTVLVTGPPASGKTAFLRLIAAAKEAIAPYGTPPDFTSLLRSGGESGRLSVTWLVSEEDAARAKGAAGERKAVIDVQEGAFVVTTDPGLTDALAPFSEATTKFELFPAHRRLGVESWRYAHPPLSRAIEDGRRLGSDPDKYAVLRRVLHDLALAEAGKVARMLDSRGVALRKDQPDLLLPYKNAVAAMLPDLRLVSAEVREGSAIPRFVRRDGRELGISELSASEEQGVLFAFAFVWLGLSGAVILVDSPEVHVPHAAQAGFFARLLRLGTDNQVIAATGSEVVLRGTPGAHVLDLAQPAERKR